MNLPVLRNVVMGRLLGMCGTLLLLCGSLLLFAATSANAAPTRQCWAWSNTTPYKSFTGLVIFDANLSIEWCGVGDKITEFRVIKCEPSNAKALLVRVSNKSSDNGICLQRRPLGESSLPMYGNIWATPTTSIDAEGAHLGPGNLYVKYDLILYPNGMFTGGVS